MISSASIASGALALVGESPILSLLDESARARYCALHFELLRDALLTSHPWNFAKKRVDLVAVSTPTPAFKYSYTFALPSDYLRMVETWPTYCEFEIQGDTVVTDCSSISIAYIYRMTDYAAYNPMFVVAFQYKLAAMLAPVLKSDFKIAQAYESLWEFWDKKAKIMDAQDERSKEVKSDDLIEVRRVG